MGHNHNDRYCWDCFQRNLIDDRSTDSQWNPSEFTGSERFLLLTFADMPSGIYTSSLTLEGQSSIFNVGLELLYI